MSIIMKVVKIYCSIYHVKIQAPSPLLLRPVLSGGPAQQSAENYPEGVCLCCAL